MNPAIKSVQLASFSRKTTQSTHRKLAIHSISDLHVQHDVFGELHCNFMMRNKLWAGARVCSLTLLNDNYFARFNLMEQKRGTPVVELFAWLGGLCEGLQKMLHRPHCH
jgi:hypothetical protein